MNHDDSPPGTPKPDLAQAPFGSSDDLPLGPHQSPDSKPPSIDLLADGVTNAHEALAGFEHHEAPIFPPLNIGLAPGAHEPPAQEPQSTRPDRDVDDAQELSGFRAFVREHPIAAVLAAAALGGLLARLSR